MIEYLAHEPGVREHPAELLLADGLLEEVDSESLELKGSREVPSDNPVLPSGKAVKG